MSFLVPAGSTMIHKSARRAEMRRRKLKKKKKEGKKIKGKKKVSRPRSRRRPSMKRSFTVRVQYAAIKREVYETRNRETGLRRGAMSGMLLASAERGSQTRTFLFIFGVPEDLLWKTPTPLPFSFIPLSNFEFQFARRSCIIVYFLSIMTVLSSLSIPRFDKNSISSDY